MEVRRSHSPFLRPPRTLRSHVGCTSESQTSRGSQAVPKSQIINPISSQVRNCRPECIYSLLHSSARSCDRRSRSSCPRSALGFGDASVQAMRRVNRRSRGGLTPRRKRRERRARKPRETHGTCQSPRGVELLTEGRTRDLLGGRAGGRERRVGRAARTCSAGDGHARRESGEEGRGGRRGPESRVDV